MQTCHERQQHGTDFTWHVLLIWFWWDATGVCSSAGNNALSRGTTLQLSSACLLHPFLHPGSESSGRERVKRVVDVPSRGAINTACIKSNRLWVFFTRPPEVKDGIALFTSIWICQSHWSQMKFYTMLEVWVRRVGCVTRIEKDSPQVSQIFTMYVFCNFNNIINQSDFFSGGCSAPDTGELILYPVSTDTFISCTANKCSANSTANK